MTVLFTFIGMFAAGLVYASFFEWTLHKHIMHSDRWLNYSYRAHQLEHHELFKADASYFWNDPSHDESHREHLTFAWWNAPLLIALHLPLFAAAHLLLGGWAASGGLFAALLCYYAMYESLHYVMHVPCDRFVEKTRFFQFIQKHHRLHHLYFLKNLNVVFPIADFVFGTRIPLQDESIFEKLEEVRRKRQARKAA